MLTNSRDPPRRSPPRTCSWRRPRGGLGVRGRPTRRRHRRRPPPPRRRRPPGGDTGPGRGVRSESCPCRTGRGVPRVQASGARSRYSGSSWRSLWWWSELTRWRSGVRLTRRTQRKPLAFVDANNPCWVRCVNQTSPLWARLSVARVLTGAATPSSSNGDADPFLQNNQSCRGLLTCSNDNAAASCSAGNHHDHNRSRSNLEHHCRNTCATCITHTHTQNTHTHNTHNTHIHTQNTHTTHTTHIHAHTPHTHNTHTHNTHTNIHTHIPTHNTHTTHTRHTHNTHVHTHNTYTHNTHVHTHTSMQETVPQNHGYIHVCSIHASWYVRKITIYTVLC